MKWSNHHLFMTFGITQASIVAHIVSSQCSIIYEMNVLQFDAIHVQEWTYIIDCIFIILCPFYEMYIPYMRCICFFTYVKLYILHSFYIWFMIIFIKKKGVSVRLTQKTFNLSGLDNAAFTSSTKVWIRWFIKQYTPHTSLRLVNHSTNTQSAKGMIFIHQTQTISNTCNTQTPSQTILHLQYDELYNIASSMPPMAWIWNEAHPWSAPPDMKALISHAWSLGKRVTPPREIMCDLHTKTKQK